MKGDDSAESESPVDSSSPFPFSLSPHHPRHNVSSYNNDLSNRKLAYNQTQLSRQIDELRATVEAQGIMVQRLLDVMEGRGAVVGSGSGRCKGKDVDRS